MLNHDAEWWIKMLNYGRCNGTTLFWSCILQKDDTARKATTRRRIISCSNFLQLLLLTTSFCFRNPYIFQESIAYIWTNGQTVRRKEAPSFATTTTHWVVHSHSSHGHGMDADWITETELRSYRTKKITSHAYFKAVHAILINWLGFHTWVHDAMARAIWNDGVHNSLLSLGW